MVVEIPLNKGCVALVDDEDAERILAHKWYVMRLRNRACAFHQERDEFTGKAVSVYAPHNRGCAGWHGG